MTVSSLIKVYFIHPQCILTGFISGDIQNANEDGHLMISDRKKELITDNGFQVRTAVKWKEVFTKQTGSCRNSDRFNKYEKFIIFHHYGISYWVFCRGVTLV